MVVTDTSEALLVVTDTSEALLAPVVADMLEAFLGVVELLAVLLVTEALSDAADLLPALLAVVSLSVLFVRADSLAVPVLVPSVTI